MTDDLIIRLLLLATASLSVYVFFLRQDRKQLELLTAQADEIISRWSGWAHHATKLKRESDDWLTRRREAMFDEPFDP